MSIAQVWQLVCFVRRLCKGSDNAIFLQKRKLMAALFSIRFSEINMDKEVLGEALEEL